MAGKFSKPPNSIANVLDKLIKDKGWSDKAYEIRIHEEWPEIIGDRISEISEPGKIENRVLKLKVQDSSWRIELQMRKESLINLINNHFDQELIVDILLK